MQIPAYLMHEHLGMEDYAESAHAQNAQASMVGPSHGSAASPGASNVDVIAAIAALQGAIATLVTLMAGRQPAPQDPPMALVTTNVQPKPLPPPPPPPPQPGVEAVKEVKISEFLKLKPPVFT